tara:strand:- start:5915 stop:6274 length:360 start_codon:yes stop_codon:yes gene_type:complete
MTLIEVACSLAILAVAGTCLARLVASQHALRRAAASELASELRLDNAASRLDGVAFDAVEVEVAKLNDLYRDQAIQWDTEPFVSGDHEGIHIMIQAVDTGSPGSRLVTHRWRLRDAEAP